jgi:hypothetical protein
MSTIADYVGRTADVSAFYRLAKPGVASSLLAQELARPTSGGEIVTGILKLSQRVLLILLTKIGSRQYLPLEGTTFMIDAGAGRWRTPADVIDSFYAARLDVSRQCREAETETDPLDERWGNLELIDVSLSGSSVALKLDLTSAAGSKYQLISPITVPIN